MYYPYLRARQFELIAWRELSADNSFPRFITPVFEPVRRSLNGLNIANRVFNENDCRTYLIVNPLQGEVAGDGDYFLNYLNDLEDCSFQPAFHYTNNAGYILDKINNYPLEQVMLVCLDSFEDNQSLRELCSNPAISHIMVLDPYKHRRLNEYIHRLEKIYIRLDDVFEKQVRNADYLDIPAHKFSEEHLFFNEYFNGFADFTVLPSDFVDGGSTPRAVVIHFSYINCDHDNEIWIRHFTSDTNDSIANVQLKFAEAARKAVSFCYEHGLHNPAIAELQNYVNEERYPGLGMVKKISIKNHLCVVRDYLMEVQ